MSDNAEKIRDLGEEMYKRLSTFTGHISKLGKSLAGSIDHYNKAVGSFDRQVIPGAKKVTEMGIRSAKQLENLEPEEKEGKNTNQEKQGETSAS